MSRVVGSTYSILIRTLPPLLAAAAIVNAPFAALKWSLPRTSGHGNVVANILSSLDHFLPAALVEAFVVLLVCERLRGSPIRIGRSIAAGGRRIATVLGIAVVLNLPNFLAALLSDGASPVPNVLVVLVQVIANVTILVILCVPIQIAVVERLGLLASLRRCRDLTRGYRSTVFGVYVVGILTLVAAVIVVEIAAYLPLALLHFESSDLWKLLFDYAGNVVSTSFTGVLSSVLYYELRDAKEGIGIDELVAVFE